MDIIKPMMTARHYAALEENPFGHFLNMPKIYHSFLNVSALLKKTYNVETRTFWFGGKTIPVVFDPREFCIMMGLQFKGIPIDKNLKIETPFIRRVFGGKLTQVKRHQIAEKLEEYAVRTDQQSIEDFCRLYIIFACNTFLLPKGNFQLPRYVYPHVEKLERVGDFAWGKLVYDVLIENIEAHLAGAGGYFDGCTIGLLAWVSERITSLGFARTHTRQGNNFDLCIFIVLFAYVIN
ncbi:PREDICTED: uncharacterized protein LOC105951274 [Erythranthe guttata]|uniref:uncharacterized protein LOC105951274 n=1 Tax=Erythranthe guttata TaxID=4155 RepID=UPI00064DE387|nr:PREDICTED: uncharacterized protein LOC105951274 [Erythranthe guttata]|eukprot:XP_012830130.1 PREDICTED: uncharacterized protein LOC105951274 [Erythranthe guttata]